METLKSQEYYPSLPSQPSDSSCFASKMLFICTQACVTNKKENTKTAWHKIKEAQYNFNPFLVFHLHCTMLKMYNLNIQRAGDSRTDGAVWADTCVDALDSYLD